MVDRQLSPCFHERCVPSISDRIVDTFTFLTPYFVTVILFALLACPFSPPPPRQCCNAISVILGNKQATLSEEQGLCHNFFRNKKSGVSWCTNSAMERQCVN